MDWIINFYDSFADNSLMNDLLHDKIQLFGPLFWTLFSITLGTVLVYYYVLNNKIFVGLSQRFATKKHWFILLIVSVLLVFITHAVTLAQMADKQIPRIGGDPVTYFFDQSDVIFYGFSAQVAGLSAVLFFLLSLALKWGSTHAKRTPF